MPRFYESKKCNASSEEYYQKGKRQNFLRERDIEKIIDTYKHRRDADRYSRKVPMEEIEQNGWNLNISRYVSTAVGEEEIDLAAVH
ncbi:MAG TPA: N-6 DNA methylase [Flavipsychrobacter sp.]|nr:N-6 DNA methylase [Flavipsychrobacter sp.]